MALNNSTSMTSFPVTEESTTEGVRQSVSFSELSAQDDMLLNIIMKKSQLLEPLDCHKQYPEPNLHLENVKLTEG